MEGDAGFEPTTSTVCYFFKIKRNSTISYCYYSVLLAFSSRSISIRSVGRSDCFLFRMRSSNPMKLTFSEPYSPVILFFQISWNRNPSSLVSGFFFYKYRRLLPLVIAHIFYDGIQVALLLITYPN